MYSLAHWEKFANPYIIGERIFFSTIKHRCGKVNQTKCMASLLEGKRLSIYHPGLEKNLAVTPEPSMDSALSPTTFLLAKGTTPLTVTVITTLGAS